MSIPSPTMTPLDFHEPCRDEDEDESVGSFTTRIFDDVDTWFAPDPVLFPLEPDSVPLCNHEDEVIREKLSFTDA